MTSDPRLSVIIPCRDDEEALARLLPKLSDSRLEIIVINSGGSHQRVTKLCSIHNARYQTVPGPRGLRLRAGARLARAPYLWFLYADAQPTEDAVNQVIECLDGGRDGGYFGFRLTGTKTLWKLIMEWSVALRCRFGGVPYGDQALFVRATTYHAAGEHTPLPLFEEVKLVRQLRRWGRFGPVKLSIGVDSRRWDKEGYAIRTLKNRCIALAYSIGVSPERLARWYVGGRKEV